VKVPVTSKAGFITEKKIRLTRIKDEIKFLYMKKDQLNENLYQIHLEVAQEWGNAWHIIQDNIHEYVNKDVEKK
jgi:hypothetical protein